MVKTNLFPSVLTEQIANWRSKRPSTVRPLFRLLGEVQRRESLGNIEVVTGDSGFGFIGFIDFAIFVIDIYRLPWFDKKFSKRDLKDFAKAIQIFVAGETATHSFCF